MRHHPFLRVGVLAIVLFGWTGLQNGVMAQPREEGRSLTVEEAVNIALEQNAAIKRAAYNRELQGTIVQQQRAAFLPSLSLSIGSSRRYGLTFDQTAGRLVQQSSQAMNAGLSARINLFNGFADVASLNQAQLNREQSEYNYQRTRQQVVFQVLSQYLEVVLNKEQIAIQEEALIAQQEQLERIEEFTEVGARPISDLYQQQANVANRELQLLNARQALTASKTQLIETLQLDPRGSYVFQAPPVDEQSLEPTSYDLNRLLEVALQQRPDLKAQQAQIAAARAGIRIAQSSYWPTVSLGAQIGTGYSSIAPLAFDNQLTDNRSGSIGLSISLPIFDRLTTRSRVAQARVQYKNAQLDRKVLRQNIATEVRQAYLDYQAAVKRLDVTEIQLAAAEQALEATQERYNVGSVPFSDLAAAQADYVQAASDRSQAIFQFIFQQKLIQYYLGELDPGSSLFN